MVKLIIAGIAIFLLGITFGCGNYLYLREPGRV